MTDKRGKWIDCQFYGFYLPMSKNEDDLVQLLETRVPVSSCVQRPNSHSTMKRRNSVRESLDKTEDGIEEKHTKKRSCCPKLNFFC